MRIFKDRKLDEKQSLIMPEKVKWSFWNDCFPIPEGIVCFNTRTGSLLLLTAQEYTKLSQASSCVDKRLYDLGLYADIDDDEYDRWIQDYKKGKKDKSAIDLTILVSRQCQFNCTYCFEGEKPNKQLTPDTIEHIKQFLNKRRGTIKTLRTFWFGGEPLLGFNKITELSAFLTNFCLSNKIYYSSSITTNGYALNKEKCEILVKKCSINRFVITVDGTEDVHNRRRPLLSGKGSFNTIWRNLHWLVEAGANIVFRITIDKDNVNNIPSLLDKIANSALANRVNIVFVRTIEILNTPDHLSTRVFTDEEFAPIEMNLIDYAYRLRLINYKLPHQAPLGGCLRQGDITIGTDGEIYKCLDTIGEDKWVISSIADVESSKQPDWYSEYMAWTPQDSEQCRACKLQPLCSGGCPHNAIFADKKHGSDIQCPDWKPNYRNQIARYIREEIKRGNACQV